MNAFDAMRTARTMAEPALTRLVFIMLAGRIGDHDRAWPSISTLCADTGMGSTAVRAALRRLVEDGHIGVDRRAGTSSLWTIGPRHTPSPDEGVTPSPRTTYPIASHHLPPRQTAPEVDKKKTRSSGPSAPPENRADGPGSNGNGTGPAPGESWGEYRERVGR
jgi:Helix-turn-helix domain